MTRRTERGSVTVEFVLAGLPVIVLMVAFFGMSIQMWNYHVLGHAVKSGTRFAIVHGRGCAETGNTCAVTVSRVAQEILDEGFGLDRNHLKISLTSSSQPQVNCDPITQCLASAAVWPPVDDSAPGQRIRITATYTAPGLVPLFWPGVGMSSLAISEMRASSSQAVEF